MQFLVLMVGVFACSTAVILIKSSGESALLLAGWRCIVASCVLSPLFLWDLRKHRGRYTRAHLKRSLLPGVLLSAHFISWIIGARLTAVANSSLIVNMVPLAMPFLLYTMLREKLTRHEINGTIVALAGVLLMARSDLQFRIGHFYGDVTCLLSMLFFCLYLLLARRNRDVPSVWLYLVPLYFVAGVTSLAVAFALDDPIKAYPRREIGFILALALVPTIIGHSILNYAMKHLRGQVVALGNLGQMLFAGVMGWLILSEKPAAMFYAAAAAVVCGMAWSTRAREDAAPRGDGTTPAGRPPRRRRRVFAAGCLLLPFVLLVLVEIALRLLWPQPPRGFSEALFETRDGHTFVVPGRRGTQYSREFHVTVEGNARGYRAGTWPEGTDADGAVWMFGDSFAFGWGVEAEETAAALLNRDGLRVADLGVPGDGLADYRARLVAMLAGGTRPKQLLILLYDNDLSQAVDTAGTAGGSAAGVPWSLRLRQAALQLHLARLCGRVMDRAGLADRAAAATGFEAAQRAVFQRDLAIHRKTTGPAATPPWEEPLRELLADARRPGVPVLLVRLVPVYAAGGERTQEALAALGMSEADVDLERVDSKLARICASTGARFARFAAATPQEERDRHFRHDMHLTPEGHRALAAFLRDRLADAGKPEAGPSVVVRAKLTEQSWMLTLKQIAPYVDLLVVNEYAVEDIVAGREHLGDRRRIRVLQWAIVKRKSTGLAALKVGQTYRLTLEPWDARRDLRRYKVSDTLIQNPRIPMYYEAGSGL